ncbi:MAG: alpha-L-fucosidase [Clostridia bacterium]|nr:alpha-L-fucosidase [Clostridia bacterium]
MKSLKPTDKQLRFLDWEVGVFFHFGIRTFYVGHTDWDGKTMDAARFDPKALDCRQWVRAAKNGGARYCILTAKHHDGFALWQSDFTDYGVAASPWKNGTGDVVRDFTDACRAEGMAVGLYYSPAQVGAKKLSPQAYNDYFVGQVTELLTRYGKIDYLWFDGCGTEKQTFDRARVIRTVRALQPDILLFELWDPDTRWVGNEEGIAPLNTRCTVTLPEGAVCVGERTRFLPFECDCKLHPDTWFWDPTKMDVTRSAENLAALYLLSVGRGGNLLLNIGPDDRGLLPEQDAAQVAALGDWVRNSFSAPLPVTAATRGRVTTLSCRTALEVNTVDLREDLGGGERVTAYALYYHDGAHDVLLCAGTAVGHRQILRFPAVLLGGARTLKLVTEGRGARVTARCFSITMPRT